MLTLTAIKQDFLTHIENTCVLFGSRSIDVHEATSDYDYFTDATNMEFLVLYLTYNEIAFENKKVYHDKLEFKDCIELVLDRKIQIMCYENGDARHSLFLQHIETVKSASKHLDMHAKPYRCHFFENCYLHLQGRPNELTALELTTIARLHPEYLI